MCTKCDCYNPNKPASLTIEDQAALWADIKATRTALEARVSFLLELGHPEDMLHIDPKLAKLEALTEALWARFRVL